MNRRQTFEVINTSASAFVEPKTLEEAADRKTKLQGEIEKLQAELSAQSGGRPSREFTAWRSRIIASMNSKKEELRKIRAWLANNSNTNKPSEWTLLARAHHLLERIAPANDEEVETLLDDIEFVVPGSYLQDKAVRTG